MVDDEKNDRKVGRLRPDKKLTGKGFRSTKKKLEEFQKNRRLDAAERFKDEALDRYQESIKSIVAVGSITRDKFESESDLDLLVFVDDTKEGLTKKKRNEIEKELKDMAESCGKTKSGSHILHVQPPWTITEYWDMMRRGNPVAHSMTEDAVALYDTGFFEPLQRLYRMGKLPATKQSAERRMSKVPKRLKRAERMKMIIVGKDIYNAMTDALQSILVYMGDSPVPPKHLAEKAREKLVKNELIDEKYIDWYEEVYSLYKDISDKNIEELSGEELDDWIERGKEFSSEMHKALKKLEVNRMARGIQRNYEAMVKTSVAALKALDELPEDPKKLPKAFKEHLIEGELIDPRYENVFGRVLKMKKKLKDKDIENISEQDINMTRNYVRNFMKDIREMLSDMDVDLESLKEDIKPEKAAKPGSAGSERTEGETEETGQGKNRCDECGREFDSERGLKIHQGKAH